MRTIVLNLLWSLFFIRTDDKVVESTNFLILLDYIYNIYIFNVFVIDDICMGLILISIHCGCLKRKNKNIDGMTPWRTGNKYENVEINRFRESVYDPIFARCLISIYAYFSYYYVYFF